MFPSPMADPAKAMMTAARLPKFSLSDIFVKFICISVRIMGNAGMVTEPVKVT